MRLPTLVRSTSALLAALVAFAGVVAAVSFGGGAAEAAASQVKTERLQGATRYETAVAIAEEYVDEVEAGLFGSEVDTVILTSGADEHFGYVLPAPALSRRHQAPVLLTEPDDLPASVRRFIEKQGIHHVIVLGGTEVVSAGVEAEVDALIGVGVERIAGADVYATAVAVAEQAGSAARVPGPFRRAVLLATGEEFADALAAGPLAYVGQYPILLTRSAELPGELIDFLRASNVDRVVILGGLAAVSIDVEFELENLGMSITRWSGKTRYDTAIDIAVALLGDNSPESCFAGDAVGLAYAWRSPDAIVSGPYLGELCAPLLLVDQRVLPGVVRDVLEETGLFDGNRAGDLLMSAFGGRAAISEQVLAAAANVAELAPLLARVFATDGACHFRVTFDEPVLTLDADDPRNYLIDGLLLDLAGASVEAGFFESTTEAVITFEGASTASGSAVPTGCLAPLRGRDTVGVAAKRIRSASDGRTVRRVEFRVRADSVRPRLTISAPRRATVVVITTNEPILGAEGGSTMEVEFRRSGLSPEVVVADVIPGGTVVRVSVPGSFDTGTSVGLLVGDQVVVRADQVTDLAGNGNFHSTRTS
ncbi:MAG: cell wall-binding repeat-containing protein [Acidimicrobiaceae bacterium]|nr:cell wall-binding repeat-containing protein [Acidimicrobiaceae bacterium]